ncbi:hypothetical protein CRYPA_1734 [uncultured Candidatus Thioglobus sp.]|nr:hypothetical protein CRYPA_1734 [uncultured Candidatus Thioglobus sp.]
MGDYSIDEYHQDNLDYILDQLKDKPNTTIFIKQILEVSNSTMRDITIDSLGSSTNSHEFFESWLEQNSEAVENNMPEDVKDNILTIRRKFFGF